MRLADFRQLPEAGWQMRERRIWNLSTNDVASATSPYVINLPFPSSMKFFRLRSGEYRFYFEQQGEALFVKWILHRNSLEDFLFRTKLPVTDQQLFEQHSKFWKYLESLTK